MMQGGLSGMPMMGGGMYGMMPYGMGRVSYTINVTNKYQLTLSDARRNKSKLT